MTLIRRIRDRAEAWCGPRTSAALWTRGSAAINACRRHVAGHALPDAAFCGLPHCLSDWGAPEGGMMWNPYMRHELGMAGDGPHRKTLPQNGGAMGASPHAVGLPTSELPSGFMNVSAEFAEIVVPNLLCLDERPPAAAIGAGPGRLSGSDRFGNGGRGMILPSPQPLVTRSTAPPGETRSPRFAHGLWMAASDDPGADSRFRTRSAPRRRSCVGKEWFPPRRDAGVNSQSIAAGCVGNEAAQEKHGLDPSRAGTNQESIGSRETAAP